MTGLLVVLGAAAGALILLGLAGLLVRRRFLLLHVTGNSMAPLILDGELVRARRIRPADIRVGDVVAIRAPASNLERVRRAALPPTPTPVIQWEEVTPPSRPRDQIVVKRVVAVAGDRVPTVPGLSGAGTVLAPGLVLVLGDNAAESFDSRQFGAIAAAGVQGRVEIDRLPRRQLQPATPVDRGH